jgi:hypothetical protein
VATRPEHRPRGQDRRGAARCRPVFPLRDWQKAANRGQWIRRTLYLIAQHRFLHFTLNHYKPRTTVVNPAYVCSRDRDEEQDSGLRRSSVERNKERDDFVRFRWGETKEQDAVGGARLTIETGADSPIGPTMTLYETSGPVVVRGKNRRTAGAVWGSRRCCALGGRPARQQGTGAFASPTVRVSLFPESDPRPLDPRPLSGSDRPQRSPRLTPSGFRQVMFDAIHCERPGPQ